MVRFTHPTELRHSERSEESGFHRKSGKILRFAQNDGAAALRMTGSEQIDHLLPKVVGVADEFLASRIDHEIQHFQWDLPDQYGAFVGNLRHFDDAVPLQDRQPDRFIDSKGNDAGGGSCRSCTVAHQPQPLDDSLWQGQERRAGVDQSVRYF